MVTSLRHRDNVRRGWLPDLASTREVPPVTEGLEAAADAFERTGGLLLAVEPFADSSRSWRRVGNPR
jgi:hypothetical protein